MDLIKLESFKPLQYRGTGIKGKKNYFNGTQRVCSPVETMAKISPHFKRVGLTRLANITGLDRAGIPVVQAIRPDSAYLAADAGKGITVEAASVSAAMECIERYHGETVSLSFIETDYQQLERSKKTIPYDKLPFIKHSLFHEKMTEKWTECWDIVNGDAVYAPLSLVQMDGYRYKASEMLSFEMGSNGLASGNNLAEAICSALYEVVERDAVTCNQIANRSASYKIPRINQDSIEFPVVRDLLDKLERAGLRVIILNCTVDTSIPVFMVYLYDMIREDIGIYKGYGAHLDPAIALSRAITEAVQARVVYIAGSRDDFFRYNFNKNKKTDHKEAIRRLEANPAVFNVNHLQSESTEYFERDISLIIKKLSAVGLDQVLVNDLTMEGFEIAVVRVIVPGLEGYLFDYYNSGNRVNKFCMKIKDTAEGGSL